MVIDRDTFWLSMCLYSLDCELGEIKSCVFDLSFWMYRALALELDELAFIIAFSVIFFRLCLDHVLSKGIVKGNRKDKKTVK